MRSQTDDGDGMPGAEAGWYADTTTPQFERWWDGQQWTQHLRAAPPGNEVWAARPAPASNGQAGNGLAVTSLVSGLLWLLWIGSITAVVTGIVALRRKVTGGHQGMAIAGIVLGSLGLLSTPLVAAVAIPVYLAQQEAAAESAVAADLRNAAIEIENAWSLAGAYPAGDDTPLEDVLAGFSSSEQVEVVLVASSADSFCLRATHAGGLVGWYDESHQGPSRVPCA